MKKLHSSLERVFQAHVKRNNVLKHVGEVVFFRRFKVLDMSGCSMTQGMHWQALKANTHAVKSVM